MPLTLSKPGDTACIKRITGKEEIKRHLASLGFSVGTEVTVVSRLGENMILHVRGVRIALDGVLANRILI